jgi:hypothetical protein
MSEQRDYLTRVRKAFSWSGVCVVAIGAYQIACSHVGMHFPSWLFNSNARLSQATDQSIAGISRLSATFSEPSAAAAFLSSWILFEMTFIITEAKSSGWQWLCVVAGTVALIETASTTGYVTVALVWLIICGSVARFVLTTGRLKVRAFIAITALALGAATALYLMPSAQHLLNSVLFEKSASASSTHRMASVGRAVNVFYATLTLGSGLGSNRAMSMPFYVLSNLGLPGIVLLTGLALHLCVLCHQRTRHSDEMTKPFIRATGAALLASVLSMAFAGAEISAPLLWILWAMLLAGVRRAWLSEFVPGVPVAA